MPCGQAGQQRGSRAHRLRQRCLTRTLQPSHHGRFGERLGHVETQEGLQGANAPRPAPRGDYRAIKIRSKAAMLRSLFMTAAGRRQASGGWASQGGLWSAPRLQDALVLHGSDH